jgi:DNA-binding response OmpR family regulator
MPILIVPDVPSRVASLTGFLKPRYPSIDLADSAPAALEMAAARRYDAIIADWGMAGMSCVAFCERLRSERGPDVPLIVLGANDSLQDKLAAFSAGTDDFLARPFDHLELGARLAALLRRVKPRNETQNILQVADLQYNTDTCEAYRAGQLIKLGPISRKLLELLLRETPRVVSRDRLAFEIWGDAIPERDLLRSHMSMLRKAVDHQQSIKLIRTVHGTGFRLVG